MAKLFRNFITTCLCLLSVMETVALSSDRSVRQADSSSQWDNIDWDDISAKIPLEKTKADRERRKALFKEFDTNGNEVLALAELDKGIRDVLELSQIFDSKSVIYEAFQVAKKSNEGGNDELVGKKEFRSFLVNLRQYFEYYLAFNRVDTDQDGRISYTEFVDSAEQIEEWVGNIDDIDAEFNKLDKNSSGFVFFQEEFLDWAIGKDLDLEDDDD